MKNPVLMRSALGLAAAGLIAAAIPIQATAAAPAAAEAPATAPATRCEVPLPTVAQRAVPSASYTASWNNISAVSDGVQVFTGGSQNQLWGTYSGNRPPQQWLQYTWSGEGTFTGASIAFWRDADSDTAGNGVAVPRAWRLQAWVGGTWQDIPLAGGASYPRAKNQANAVTFAAPVTTTRLRAVFDATTNGITYAAVGVSEFSVQGDAPQRPGAGLSILESDSFALGVSNATGGVYHLMNGSDTDYCTNYVANPTAPRPQWNIDDSRWVGDVTMRVNGQPRITGLSDDIRTVSSDGDTITVAYAGNAAHPAGIRGFGLTEQYELTGEHRDVLDWSIAIDNTSAATIEIQNLALPMLMNAWWNGGDQTGIYEQNVARHSFVAEDGSYVYWQRPNGDGPYLVMTPKSGTSLEFRDKARTGEGPFGESDPAWEGLVEFAIHSAQLQPARAGKIGGYLPATSATVAAGDTLEYGFEFRWADDYADLHDVLYDAGVVDVVSLPGMVIPTDLEATLAVRARDGIESVTGEDGKDIEIAPAGERNGYQLYRLTFPQLGAQKVTVTYGGGRTSVLQYYSVDPVEELIDVHAQFLVDKQQARTTRGYDGAFLQWDMSRERLITWDNYPGGGWKQWMAGGSDDLGLTPALYLAQKNMVEPDQEQISAIDYYIEEFLLGYLQARTENGERTYQVYRWYDGRDDTPNDQGVWRVYNYTHIANTYLAMYQLATLHPEVSTEFSASEYLEMAYRTLVAMYTKVPLPTPIGADPAHDLGLMGEGTYPEILAALEAEGMTAEAATLTSHLEVKRDYLFAQKYPFASEASIDTTGFEASYTFAKLFDNRELIERVQSASLSARGLQPLWYYYGGDNRHMGESWWNLGYETHLGAWQQQDYLAEYSSPADRDFDDAMRSTYGAYLGGWANINTGQISASASNIGAASWQYQSQLGAGEGSQGYWGFMPMIKGWWAWSGEADLGFWGGLRTAEVAVVDDAVVGVYAYGGDLDTTGGDYRIVPKDGVRQRFTLYDEGGFAVELAGARYSEAVVKAGLDDLSLTIDGGGAAEVPVRVALDNLPDGEYHVAVDGVLVPTTKVQVADGVGELSLTVDDGAVVRLWQDDEAPVITVPDSVDATATGPGGAAVSYEASATDNVDGDVSVVCTPESGAGFSLGFTTVTCDASDLAGNLASAEFPVHVTYPWSGFLPPVVAGSEGGSAFTPVNPGSVLPLRFSLGGDMGLDILTEPASAVNIACTAPHEPVNGEAPLELKGPGVIYDPETGEYVLVWKTAKSATGCWRVDLDFADEVTRSVHVSFTK